MVLDFEKIWTEICLGIRHINGKLFDPEQLKTEMFPGWEKQRMEECPDGELSVTHVFMLFNIKKKYLQDKPKGFRHLYKG